MKVTGSYYLDSPRASVWQGLLSPETLAACIPGCESFEEIGENSYSVVMKVGIGAVRGTYSGEVSLSDIDEPSSFRMTVAAQGRGGSVRGEGLLILAEHGAGTDLTVEGDAQVTGVLARVGQRLIGGASKALMDRFFGCLKSRLEGLQAPNSAA